MTLAPVVLFDGDCAFCSSTVRVARRLVCNLPAMEPYQHADLPALGVDSAACAESVQLVRADGTHASGEVAVAEMLVIAGGVWRGVGRFLQLPGVRAVAGAVYRWVARHRHQLPGGTKACSLPRQPS